MRSLSEIINEGSRMVTIKTEEKNNISWTNGFEDLVKYGRQIAKEYLSDVKNLTIDKIKNYYDTNPRKRTAIMIGKVNVKMCMKPNQPIVGDLYSLYKRLGINYWWFNKLDNVNIVEYTITAKSPMKSSFMNDDIDWSQKKYEPVFSGAREFDSDKFDSEFVTEYREKALSCITKTTVSVKRDGVNLLILLTPIFDEAKTKKLYQEIVNDDYIKEFLID